ncbi:MAG: hypothetical protein AAF674_22440, partial [Pseudomonadota bacterium]
MIGGIKGVEVRARALPALDTIEGVFLDHVRGKVALLVEVGSEVEEKILRLGSPAGPVKVGRLVAAVK